MLRKGRGEDGKGAGGEGWWEWGRIMWLSLDGFMGLKGLVGSGGLVGSRGLIEFTLIR